MGSLNVLVIGGSGGLGRYVVQYLKQCEEFKEISYPSHNELDIRQLAPHKREIRFFKTANVVIHLAAKTDVRDCEQHVMDAVLTNAYGTTNVVRACLETKAHLIYMSTDAVFSGEGPHLETDIPSPNTVYGWSKLAGEQAVTALAKQSLIVRANFFTRHCNGKQSFASHVVDGVQKEDGVVGVYTNVQSTPVFAGTLAKHIAEAAAERLRGVLHIASTDSINRLEQAKMICEEYKLPMNFLALTEDEPYDGRLASCIRYSTVREEIKKMAIEEPLP